MTPRTSLTPAKWRHTSSNFEDVFEKGARILGKRHLASFNIDVLWVPLPPVPPWPGDATRQMSPKKYIQTVGPLVLLKGTAKPLLAAPTVGALSSSKRRKGQSRQGSGPENRVLIPMFVGVPAVTIEKKLNVVETIQNVVDETDHIIAIDETI